MFFSSGTFGFDPVAKGPIYILVRLHDSLVHEHVLSTVAKAVDVYHIHRLGPLPRLMVPDSQRG